MKVCVAALTRRRPKMLRELLESWQKLRIPDGVDVTFLVVENDDQPHSLELVQEFGSNYLLEPRINIATARNRAIFFMLDAGSDLLAFVDDDEIVSSYWLEALVDKHRETGAMLIGGPVLALAGSDELSLRQSLLMKGIAARYEKVAERAARRSPQKTTIITNNWIGHRSLFEEFGLRFDVKYGISGGEDAAFDDEVTAMGLTKAWASRAWIAEIIPIERMCFRYQLRRARNQSAVSFQRKFSQCPTRAVLFLVPSIVLRTAGLVVLICALPDSLLSLARGFGWIAGRVLGAAGYPSNFYKRVTGN